MSVIVWANGEVRSPGDVFISPLDHGFTVGDGVFETIAIRNNQAFALTRHLGRLQYSLDRMSLPNVDRGYIANGIHDVLAAGEGKLIRIRVTVTSGTGPLGMGRSGGAPTVVIAGAPGVRPRTCKAVRAPWKRNERSVLAGVKTTSYAENVMMLAYATDRGGDEAIVSNTHGHLCEGTSTNIFIERGGEILTPPLASGCLPGIARGLALEWGVGAGLPVRVAAPGELEMAVLDEVLRREAGAAVSSVTRGVQMVTSMDGADVTPGPLLPRLRQVFEASADADPDPAPPRAT